MNLKATGYRPVLSWLTLAMLVALVCVLGVLQYRWIGEISEIQQKKLKDALQANLNEVSRDFNFELNSACAALLPTAADIAEQGRERAYENRYAQWKDSDRFSKLVARIALVWEEGDQLTLRMLNSETGQFVRADWPEHWNTSKQRISARIRHRDGPGGFRGFGGPGGSPQDAMDETNLIDLPRFGDPRQGWPPRPDHGPPTEAEWLLIEVDAAYAANSVLPELLARHFGGDFQSEYETALFTTMDRSKPPEPAGHGMISAPIFAVAPQIPGGRGPGSREVRAGGPGGRGRWQLAILPKTGSLDTVVAHARWRNLGISGGILLLLLATGAALVRFTSQAQRLAEVEMDFVAGVSHELRTPLTVIRTAAFNLRGKLANNPSQVESYGALIQQESEKLTAIVQQVLRFASAKRGRIIQAREAVSVETLIEETLQSSQGFLDEGQCEIETRIEPALPLISGDSMALRHALQNLISNAVKYGMDHTKWIGIFARSITGSQGPMVEVRISDRGPGIPPQEQTQIFEAFFRGKRAMRDQIHGTGLGLNLVKKIIEAHGGTVDVESEPDAGTSFIVRIPVRTGEHRDELAHSLG
jgi:signal transduction histidine kinase